MILVDEINRASPKTQSALLECMEEGQVTVDGETRILPRPFMIIATQNPVEYEGTFPLPEAQLDRFAARVAIGYPAPGDEAAMLVDLAARDPLDLVDPVSDERGIMAARADGRPRPRRPGARRLRGGARHGHPPRPARSPSAPARAPAWPCCAPPRRGP